MDLYYRAYEVHELLAHRAAELGGFYQQAGIEVNLKDGSGPKGQNLDSIAPVTLGVGGAVLSCLTQGTKWAIASVNTQHPLFWFATQASLEKIEQLKGKRVAGPPPGPAPALFARIIFRHHGLDLMKDCTYLPGPPGPSLEMLKRGETEACFVSAAPFDLERMGYRIFFFGAEFHAATTGLAINKSLAAVDSPEVQRMVTANRNALGRLHSDRDFALRTIQDIKPQMSTEDTALLYDRYIHPYWTEDGRPDQAKAESGMREMAHEIGVHKVPTFAEIFIVS
jgi:ABC-type nitrate/sulfonate/bicarbonate transport system substrate-binding protein